MLARVPLLLFRCSIYKDLEGIYKDSEGAFAYMHMLFGLVLYSTHYILHHLQMSFNGAQIITGGIIPWGTGVER